MVTRTSAHPRSRGEHDHIDKVGIIRFGSSPLARGTPPAVSIGIRNHRLIPARAGNTLSASRRSGILTAHPRSRGEHPSVFHAVTSTPGSSPLARGTPPNLGASRLRSRLIPARAGNTAWRAGRGSSRTAHPRSRGEHLEPGGHAPLGGGSSPLARGTQSEYGAGCPPYRLIPARAGNTSQPASITAYRAAHPRSRGEH